MPKILKNFKKIPVADITNAVVLLCHQACCILPEDVKQSFLFCEESSESGRKILELLIKNADIAREENLPICQDCGVATFFLELGQDVYIEGDLYAAINAGVRQGYQQYYLRKSICHPLTRENTGDNTPAIIHVKLTPGNQLKIFMAPKGGGADNVSRLFMLPPSVGKKGIIQAAVDTMRQADANPCPPVILAVAIGGSFDEAPKRAKELLLRSLDFSTQDPMALTLEKEIYKQVNELAIGPAGLGGSITCLKVWVDIAPCHIASLPVAINVQCHAARHAEVVL